MMSRVRSALALSAWALPVAASAGLPASLPNGVSSGDTTQSSTVLWTRSTTLGDVVFEYSTDPTFSSIAGSSTRTITDPTLPVKAEIAGLSPGSQYYYRVTDASSSSLVGSFRTSTAPGVRSGLRFGVSGDWRGELAPYPAIRNAASRNLDLFVKLGDTIYADVPSPAVPSPQATTLADFRAKHGEVYGTRFGVNAWAELQATTSILSGIDDHEVTNDFAGGASPASDPRFSSFPGQFINDTPLFETGLQAFQEYNAVRDEFYGATGDARTAGERKLYRQRTLGQDAAVFSLDARSFRDEELPGITSLTDPGQVVNFLTSSFDPSRTMLGRAQLDDLKADLLSAQAESVTWKFVMVPEPIQNLGPAAASDRFEGYAAERTEILQFIDQNNIENVVFVAADIHGTIVNNLTYQTAPFGPQIPTGAFEITTGSVAYDAPFGPTVVGLAGQLGLLSPEQIAFYESLPRDGQDAFLREVVDTQLALFGYDPLGLEGSGIDATLLQGSYVATHTFGWTEFDIDPVTQALTVTTYGIDPYTEAALLADPSAILGLEPVIVSQFVVNPVPAPGAALPLVGLLALARRRR